MVLVVAYRLEDHALRRALRQLGGDVRLHRLVDADVALRSLGQEPAVLEHLVEHFRRRQPALEPLGHCGDRRLEHLLTPLGGDRRLCERPACLALALFAVAGDVVEHAARLVLLRVEPGEAEQAVAVVPGLDDVRVEREPVAAVGRVERDLLDVEPELVEAVQPLVQPVALVGPERLVARQLVPERRVTSDDLLAGLVRIDVRRQSDLGVDVEQLADDVLLRDLEIVGALADRERSVQLAGLRVDEIRRESAGVAPEERIRERAVAPEEAAEMQAREQLGKRVQQVRTQVGNAAAREENAIRQRVVEMTRDQRCVEVAAARGDDPDRLDDRQTLPLEPAQQRPLAPGRALGELLDGIQRTVVFEEADDVAADPADDRDEALRLPLLEWGTPGQVEKARVARAGDQLEGRAQAASVGRAAGCRRRST